MNVELINGPGGFGFFTPDVSMPFNFTEPVNIGGLNDLSIFDLPNFFPVNNRGQLYLTDIPEFKARRGPFVASGLNLKPYLVLSEEYNIFKENLSVYFEMPEFVPAPLGFTQSEYQEILNDWYLTPGVQYGLVLTAFFELKNRQVFIDPDFNPANFINPDGTPNLAAIMAGMNPMDMPFVVFGPRDAMRMVVWLSSSFNQLSQAYGTGQSHIFFPERPGFFAKLWSGIKKFFPGFVVMRNAVLGVVAVNALNLADKLAGGDLPKIRRTWESFGGEWVALRNAIRNGSGQQINGIGEPVTAVALIAAATPIIVKLLEFVNLSENERNAIEAGLQLSVNEECRQYRSIMLQFAAGIAEEYTDVEFTQVLANFNVQYPAIPVECLEDLSDLLRVVPGSDRVVNVVDNLIPPDEPDEPDEPEQPEQPESNANEEKNFAAIALLIALGIFALK